MTVITSAWEQHPGYRIDLIPCRATARVLHAGLLVAESNAALLVRESHHDIQLYLPRIDVNWELFEPTDYHTICPFKGEADYWALTASNPPLDNIVWTYRHPLAQVAGLKDYVAFCTNRIQVQLDEAWANEPGHSVKNTFPIWGDAEDLIGLIDVQPDNAGHFIGKPYPDPPLGTFLEIPAEKRQRSAVEGGHMLGQAIVAASKTLPAQRVTSASMIFTKAASFNDKLDINIELLHGGRMFSTAMAKVSQAGKLRASGLLLLDAGAPDRIRQVKPMPDVAGPQQAQPYDMGVTGRELRIVDGAYTSDLNHIGPPELYAWMRFRDAPRDPFLHAAVMTQATPHWTIAAALRPHPGLSEALAHVSLSTSIMKIDISFHDEVDITEWMLYSTSAVYAGKGQAQGVGHVFGEDGRLLASYSIHAMIRDFAVDPTRAHKGYDGNAM